MSYLDYYDVDTGLYGTVRKWYGLDKNIVYNAREGCYKYWFCKVLFTIWENPGESSREFPNEELNSPGKSRGITHWRTDNPVKTPGNSPTYYIHWTALCNYYAAIKYNWNTKKNTIELRPTSSCEPVWQDCNLLVFAKTASFLVLTPTKLAVYVLSLGSCGLLQCRLCVFVVI